MKSKRVVTITGPSCAGKSTLEGLLVDRGFKNIISTTTRQMRDGEVNGESYYFIDKSKFKRLQELGAFAESVFFNGNYYGVEKREFERVFSSDAPVVVIVEPSGLEQLKETAKREGWDLVSVFVDNPTEVITARFIDRFLIDIEATDNAVTERRIADIYSKRLAAMMDTERNWRVGAYLDSGKELYTVRLDRFDETNKKEVVNYICDMVEVNYKGE